MQAIILAGGKGRRLLPATKVLPKSMLPVIWKGEIKPAIQAIFELLYDSGVREFLILHGENETIRKHFDIDYEQLREADREGYGNPLIEFYSRLANSRISFYNEIGNGTGSTLLKARHLASKDFLLTAADMLLDQIPPMPPKSVLAAKTRNPNRYTVLTLDNDVIAGMAIKSNTAESDLRLLPYMYLDGTLFDALEHTKARNGQLYVHDALARMVSNGERIKATIVPRFYDLGEINSYADSFTSLALIGRSY